VLSQAVVMGASGQIRNMATTGGNLMQRTRCHYFYDREARCNKRQPGAGCDALEGFTRMHAILGASSACIATHPSDMCVALAALDATVVVQGPGGQRSIPMTEFHRLPGDTPHIDTNLRPDELITAIEVPPLPFARRSSYRKVRDRASYAFALVSVAAALDVEGRTIRSARLALGGVAHKPWRATAAERILVGAPATVDTFQAAAAKELEPARGHRDNAFKIALAQRLIVSVLTSLLDEGDGR
jgi:xanthine dehydrogenase YagS FAD-binding subunit